MAKYTEAKNIIINEMNDKLSQLRGLLDGLDAVDRIEDYDLIDQVHSMDAKLTLMQETLQRVYNINNPSF
jgi:Mlc titration factor MtfA (ptsG expression regulator)